MIRNEEKFLSILKLCRAIKKPNVVISKGCIRGSDTEYTTLNVVYADIDIGDYVYSVEVTSLASIAQVIKHEQDGKIEFDRYGIHYYDIANKCIISAMNIANIYLKISSMYQRIIGYEVLPIIYQTNDIRVDENINSLFSIKAKEGMKFGSIDGVFILSFFNSIHPITKSDKVSLIIYDISKYAICAKFIIQKKDIVIYEYIGFRKM